MWSPVLYMELETRKPYICIYLLAFLLAFSDFGWRSICLACVVVQACPTPSAAVHIGFGSRLGMLLATGRWGPEGRNENMLTSVIRA